MGTALARSEAQTDLRVKAASYNLMAETVDGMDVVSVELAARRANAHVRAGGGPAFLECRTYRFCAHSMFDAQPYRPKDEIEQWKSHGPIVHFANCPKGAGILHDDELAAMEAEIGAEAAVAFAEASPWEPVDNLTQFVTMDQMPGATPEAGA